MSRCKSRSITTTAGMHCTLEHGHVGRHKNARYTWTSEPHSVTYEAQPVVNEAVHHPQHYGGDTVYEAVKVILAWKLGFNLGNAVKYLSRAGKKDPTKMLEDLRKARWYLDYEIKSLEAETTK